MVSTALLLAAVGFAPALLAQQGPATADNDILPNSTDHECGKIVAAALEAGSSPWYFASQVFECLTSIPFNAAVATRFVTYYNQTLQFQSTVELLKSPPSSYKQPAVDLIQGLNIIQTKINAGSYVNQYAFEYELQSLVLAAHDAHLSLFAGALNQFSFGSFYDLITLSEDGKAVPKVYVRDDDLDHCISRGAECTPTPVETMNGIPVVEFLSGFASNQSYGLLEPHADWNQLMLTPALTIQGGLTTFGGAAPLYPGDGFDDSLNITLQNGDSEKYSFYWLSLYNSPGYTGPLATGGDFYNYYVLGLDPASYNQTDYYACLLAGNTTCGGTSNDSDSNSTVVDKCSEDLTSWHCLSPAYPDDPLIHEANLSPVQSGIVTGYMLHDISTAVLSLPSFDGDIVNYTKATGEFFRQAKSASHVIVDLQQNTGGEELLALDVYRRFFPNDFPFTGSRMRASSMADAIGQTFTSAFKNVSTEGALYDEFLASEWIVTDRINARTGQEFNSWAEYFGPVLLDDDYFTLTQEYNLTDDYFDYYDLGGSWTDGAFNTSVSKPAGPWAAKDIVILTDGLCTSTCSFFVELMSVKGVRTVVVGGRPEPGPMQVSSGRGAAAYSSDQVDADIETATNFNISSQSQLPVRGNTTDTGMVIYFAGLNLRDQVRENATLPNQLLYFPADCRIYWTFKNYNNYTRLWQDTWSAIYSDSSLCIGGLSNTTEAHSQDRRRSIPRHGGDVSSVSISPYILKGLNGLADLGVEDDPRYTGPGGFPPLCTTNNKPDQHKCAAGTVCSEVQNQCGDPCKTSEGLSSSCKGPKELKEYRCLKECLSGVGSGSQCSSSTQCNPRTVLDGSVNASGGKKSQGSVQSRTYSGFCTPQWTDWRTTSCKQLRRQWGEYNQN